MKPNKISITLLLCLAAAIHTGDLRAQSLQSLLKMFGRSKTEQKTEPKTEIPSAEQLQGRWVYGSLDMTYTGDSAIASVAVASAKTQLPTVAEKAGLAAGRDRLEIGGDGTAKFVSGERSAAFSYSYRPENGKMTVGTEHGGKSISLTAEVRIVDGKLHVMFDAARLVAEAEKHSAALKENTYFQMLKAMTDNYPGIMIGAVFGK